MGQSDRGVRDCFNNPVGKVFAAKDVSVSLFIILLLVIGGR